MAQPSLLSSDLENELFRTKSGKIEYVVIEQELHELYDFCISFQESMLDALSKLGKKKRLLQQHLDDIYKDDNGFGWTNKDVVNSMEEFAIPSSKRVLEFTVPMNQILLLTVFVEKSLKSLCSEYHSENVSRVYGAYAIQLKQGGGKSKVRTYIEFLQEKCSFQITLPVGLEYLDGHTRKARNYFVHGDWDDAEQALAGIDLTKMFAYASDLFRSIENEFLKR